MADIERDEKCRVPEAMKSDMRRDHVTNFGRAIRRLNRASAPGANKLTPELMLLLAEDPRFLEPLPGAAGYGEDERSAPRIGSDHARGAQRQGGTLRLGHAQAASVRRHE